MQDQASANIDALTKKDLTINAVTFSTPKYVLLAVIKAGFAKAQLPIPHKLVLGFLAGGYIALGGLISMIVAGGMSGQEGLGVTNPGLQRLLAAASFPFCLMLVVLAGSELFTSNCMALPAAAFAGKITPGQVAKSLLVSYLCNFAGALFVGYFLVYLPNVLGAEPYVSYVKKFTLAKINQGWGTQVLKGIGANWLVCLAIWNSLAAGDVPGKILGIWWPIFAFVLAGFEHSVANMFYLPVGLMYGADSNVGHFLWDHLVPVTLGNFIGGCVMVAMPTYYIWGEHAAPQVAVMTVRPVPGIPKSASNISLPPRIASMHRDLALQQYVNSASKKRAGAAPGQVASYPLDGAELSQVVIHGDLGSLGRNSAVQQ